MDFYNGQIIYRQPQLGYRHYGVIVFLGDEIHVMDNFPGKGARIRPFEKFLYADEKVFILNNQESTTDELLSRFEEVEFRTFSACKWNCEHFAYHIAGMRIQSQQVGCATLLGAVLFLI